MSKSVLIAKAEQGKLSTGELQQIAQELISGDADPYEALLVIGRAGAMQYRSVVDGYLQFHDDPMLARLALQVLCRYWGLAGEYLEEIICFVRKVDWDEDDDIRLMAIDCAGSLLVEQRSSRLLSLLLQIFRDHSERQIVREAAYCSLALATGKRLDELPTASRHFDLEHDVDASVIVLAEEILKKS